MKKAKLSSNLIDQDMYTCVCGFLCMCVYRTLCVWGVWANVKHRTHLGLPFKVGSSAKAMDMGVRRGLKPITTTAQTWKMTSSALD